MLSVQYRQYGLGPHARVSSHPGVRLCVSILVELVCMFRVSASWLSCCPMHNVVAVPVSLQASESAFLPGVLRRMGREMRGLWPAIVRNARNRTAHAGRSQTARVVMLVISLAFLTFPVTELCSCSSFQQLLRSQIRWA